ncbi:ABC transporter ATP-binding protein [Actinomadura sp. 7K507]|uniref:ABC transporter ATP-binding protein n=1 Tax=Actinomadura sp. 7K507 TaxID=2530365 RepID=UPI00104DD6DE|nr:ABC transporter ATP-binding protein [Actinomadura sp. 7K507]TDC92308.1 ABC transporter ATP-binding protein [Actinomadura sp. 7K507]
MMETHGLTKRYGRTTAVEALSLRVDPGEVYGFLGLNGAGKSTAIRMMLGMTRPTGGSVRLLGRAEPDWSRVGHLVDGAHAYPGLTVRENLEISRRLRRVRDRHAVDEAMTLFGLVPYRDKRAGTLSMGNAQRLGLAKAVLHRPALLVLDEPANGLDPAGIVELRGILRRLAHEEGTAILVSSHILAEVARTADRIGVIDQGRMLTEFPASDLPRCTCGVEDLEDVFLRLLTERRREAAA